jgi:hypothetical protein
MIQADTVVEIKDSLQSMGVDESSVSQLRQKWPDIHFTYCSEDDIHAGKPVQEANDFYLYLVDSSEHCLCLTSDYDTATGLVVAERYDDE